MKNLKHFWLIFGFFFCVGLVNCDDTKEDIDDDEEECVDCGEEPGGDDDDNPTPPINEPETFKVEAATFKPSEIPQGNEDIVNISGNTNIINGGSGILTFISDEELTHAYITADGVNGHYICELEEIFVEHETRSETGKHTYQIKIHYGQDLPSGGFHLIISVETIDGVISRIYTREHLVVIAQTGALQISLSWDQLDDLDLHVFDPLGNHISYNNPYVFADGIVYEVIYAEFYYEWYMENFSIDIGLLDLTNEDDIDILIGYMVEYGEPDEMDFYAFFDKKEYDINGELDIDSNAACDIDGINNENIYFVDPVPGVYTIAVDLWEKCDYNKPGSQYSVSLNYKGKQIDFSDKQVGRFPNNYQGNFDEGPYEIIGEFLVEGNGTRSAGKQANPALQKLKNRMFKK